MSARIPSYLREAARLLSTELSELREFTLSVFREVDAASTEDKEETIRKYSRELAGRFHRAQGAAGFLQLVELSKFARGIEDLFRSVQETKTLDTKVFSDSLAGAAEHLMEEVRAIEQDLAQG